jgi:hypothetical protein
MTMMSRKEAAAYLKMSEQAFSNAVRRGVIPCKRISERRCVFNREMLDAWLDGAQAGGEHESVAG